MFNIVNIKLVHFEHTFRNFVNGLTVVSTKFDIVTNNHIGEAKNGAHGSSKDYLITEFQRLIYVQPLQVMTTTYGNRGIEALG